MSKYINLIFLGILVLCGVLFFFITPFILIPLAFLPLLFIIGNDLKSTASLVLFDFICFNSLFYYSDVIAEKHTDHSVMIMFGIILSFNLITALCGFIGISKNIDRFTANSEALIKRLNEEKIEMVSENSDINHVLKDYKLDFSQKISIIRKLLQLSNQGEKDILKDIVTTLKNVLGLKKFIFFRYSKKKNSFVKVHEEYVDLSEIKHSPFLKWVISRALNFPSGISLLTKESMQKNPEFSSITSNDKNLPELFLPVKSKNTLKGFLLAYEFDNNADNEYRALAQLISEVLNSMVQRDLL